MAGARGKAKTPKREAPGEARRPGRPKTVDPGLARTRRLQVMVPPEIEAEIDALRGAKPLSTWLYDVLRHTLAQCRADRGVAEMLAEPFREE